MEEPKRPVPPPGGWNPKRLLWPSEVADAFKVNRNTPAWWADRGLLSCVKTPGGMRRYFADEVEAWLALEGL